MWQLVKKDLPLFVLFSVPLQLLLSLTWFLVFNELNLAVMLVQVMFVLFTLTVLTSHSEQVEENSQGYRFLLNLPVSPLEIVGAKFLLIITTLAFLVLSNIMLFSLLKDGRNGLRLPVAFLVMAGCLALILSGLIHLGITVFGGDLFFSISSALVVILVVLYVLIFEKKKLSTNRIIDGAIAFLRQADLHVYILASIVIFLLLMLLSAYFIKTGWIGLLKRRN